MSANAIADNDPNTASRALARGLQILEILAAARYVVQQDNQTYAHCNDSSHPASADLTAGLVQSASADMELLNAEVSETVTMAVLREDHIRLIHIVESPHHIRVNNPVGRIVVPYGSSLGKAMVAWQSPEMRDLLIKVYAICLCRRLPARTKRRYGRAWPLRRCSRRTILAVELRGQRADWSSDPPLRIQLHCLKGGL